MSKKRISRKEKLRRERISRSLKLYHRTKKTKAERIKLKKIVPKLPRGFKALGNADAIRLSLERAREAIGSLHGFDGSVESARNADGSASFELRFATPEKKLDWQAILTDLVQVIKVVPGTWISIGFRFSPKKSITDEERDKYERFRGMLGVRVYSQRASPGHLATLEATAEKILDNVKKAHKGWNPHQVFVHVHWSPTGERPPKRKR